MSDYLTEEDLRQIRHDARKKVSEALAEYANAWDGVENGFITGYVVVFEVSSADRLPYVQWVTGDGSFPDVPNEELGGLVEHRVEGLLRKAIRDIISDQTTDE